MSTGTDFLANLQKKTVKNYRNTASYYDGHTMRDGSQRKRHVR